MRVLRTGMCRDNEAPQKRILGERQTDSSSGLDRCPFRNPACLHAGVTGAALHGCDAFDISCLRMLALPGRAHRRASTVSAATIPIRRATCPRLWPRQRLAESYLGLVRRPFLTRDRHRFRCFWWGPHRRCADVAPLDGRVRRRLHRSKTLPQSSINFPD